MLLLLLLLLLLFLLLLLLWLNVIFSFGYRFGVEVSNEGELAKVSCSLFWKVVFLAMKVRVCYMYQGQLVREEHG